MNKTGLKFLIAICIMNSYHFDVGECPLVSAKTTLEISSIKEKENLAYVMYLSHYLTLVLQLSKPVT